MKPRQTQSDKIIQALAMDDVEEVKRITEEKDKESADLETPEGER